MLWKKEKDRLNEALDIAYEALWAAALLHLATQDVLSTTHEQILKVCTKCVEAAEIVLNMETTVPFRRAKRKPQDIMIDHFLRPATQAEAKKFWGR